MMHKNIVLFSDGTGNSSSKLFKTNVWRTYQAIDVADPKNPAAPRQFAFYDDGVGNSSFKPLAVLGGALGVGLARNVRDLYAYVCRNYQSGDRIYAFGFSRGAFTIRVLVGLILNQGLVPYNGNEAELDRMVNAAFRAFRAGNFKHDKGLLGPLRALRDGCIRAWHALWGRPAYDRSRNIGRPEVKLPDGEPIKIEFLGLWDTVDAYGLPVDELTRAVDKFIWPLTMPDLDLSQRVKRARHALALDDERNTFHPRLWNEATEEHGNAQTRHIDQERISQVWFAGMHSDVGGGYPDDGLAYVSLVWMIQEAAKYGLRFVPRICTQYRAAMDENGPIHDSRRGLAGYYRYNPRRIDRLAHQRLSKTARVEIVRTKVHQSVLRRIAAGHDGYAPFVLPAGFAVMKFDGCIDSGAAVVGREIALPDVCTSEFEKRHEQVWNWVWWRRAAYFFTLAVTLLLVAMPLRWPALPKGACESSLCFVSYAVDLVTPLLPGFASTWTDAFTSHPEIFLTISALVVFGLWSGGVFERRVRDAMRPLWHGLSNVAGDQVPRFTPPAPPGAVNRAIQWLRGLHAYRAFFTLLTHQLLPFVFLVVVAYGAAALTSQAWFAVRSSWGDVCTATDEGKLGEPGPNPVQWQTKELCSRTLVKLQKGATYRLHVTIGDRWRDASVDAGPNGVLAGAGEFAMTLAVPLRRHPGQPWFKPIARIGSQGTDFYPLDPTPTVADPWRRAATVVDGSSYPVFATEFVARTEGELFVYVNDAVLQLPFYSGFVRLFYDNNQGSASVRIERLHAPAVPGAVAAR